MTGQINVNKIAARTGTTITIDTGDALDVTLVKGEGSATTNLKQGLAKAWLFAGSDAALQDSFNISTPTDHGTGDYSYTLTNPFSNDDYSLTATANSTDERRNATENGARSLAGTLAIETSDAGSMDNTAHNITAHGDLA